mmetsp:Transcript_17666/g.37523  ORF Transcript_17666/g.37523 Transcript_17666/m.37523 type:complete len:205 (+) Transcript_17666:592-1206(+)
MLDAMGLVGHPAWPRTNGLDEAIGLDLLILLCVHHVIAETLHLIDDALHQLVIARQKVDVGDPEDRLLRDASSRPAFVAVHRMRLPDVEADEVIHFLERVQQDDSREGCVAGAHQPRGALCPAEVPRAAEHPDLRGTEFHQGSHIFDGEGSVAVHDDSLSPAELVVCLAERAVLDVALEIPLARELDFVDVVKEARTRDHGTGN